MITAARTVNKGAMDVDENETWCRLKINAVPLLRVIGQGTEGLQEMQEEFETENEGVAIPTQVRWLANPRTIRKMRQKGVITSSLVVFVVKGSKVTHNLINKGNKAAGVWHRVEAFTSAGPDSRYDCCCGWGEIENNCSNKPKCGCCLGTHRISDHM